MKHEAGKGDSYRKVDWKKWDENYTRIFSSSKNKESTQTGTNKNKK